MAIKVTNARLSEGLNRGVIREITLLKELSHPNIIELIECETIETGTALVLEHCPYDLAGYIEQRRAAGRPLNCDPTQMRTFMSQLLVGVAHCHAKNVLHRDLKPQNLLIDSQGVLKIADFGLARQVGFLPESENLKNLVSGPTQHHYFEGVLLICIRRSSLCDIEPRSLSRHPQQRLHTARRSTCGRAGASSPR